MSYVVAVLFRPIPKKILKPAKSAALLHQELYRRLQGTPPRLKQNYMADWED